MKILRKASIWLGLAAALPSLAAQAEPHTLKPTSPWLIRYDEDRCRAVREFGTGEALDVLWLDQFGETSAYNLSLVGPTAGLNFGNAISINFGAEDSVARSYVKSRMVNKTPVLILYGVTLIPRKKIDDRSIELITPEREAAVDRIMLAGGGSRVVLETGSIGGALAELRKCAVDLEQHFREPRASAPEPLGSPGEWITDADYPAPSVRNGEEGRVHFRLMVDARGLPTACQIIESSRSEAFDDVTCVNLIKRARFKPARDLSGKPVASTFTSSVRFEIPS